MLTSSPHLISCASSVTNSFCADLKFDPESSELQVIGGFRVSGSGFKRCRGFFGIQGFRDLGIKLSGKELARSGLWLFALLWGLEFGVWPKVLPRASRV